LDLNKIHKCNALLDKLFVRQRYAKQKQIPIKSKPKMRCGRNRTIKSIANKTSSEKSDEHPPDYTLNRKAKFVPFSRDKFGFFDFVVATAMHFVGCRSPPLSLVLNVFSKFRNGGKYNVRQQKILS
jgi:hypothetical protein